MLELARRATVAAPMFAVERVPIDISVAAGHDALGLFFGQARFECFAKFNLVPQQCISAGVAGISIFVKQSRALEIDPFLVGEGLGLLGSSPAPGLFCLADRPPAGFALGLGFFWRPGGVIKVVDGC